MWRSFQGQASAGCKRHGDTARGVAQSLEAAAGRPGKPAVTKRKDKEEMNKKHEGDKRNKLQTETNAANKDDRCVHQELLQGVQEFLMHALVIFVDDNAYASRILARSAAAACKECGGGSIWQHWRVRWRCGACRTCKDDSFPPRLEELS